MIKLLLNLKASLIAVFGIILAFLMPIIPLILIVGAAIVLDTFFGILRAKKIKEPITSRKLSKVISKMVLYNSAIILFFCIEKFILGDFLLLITEIHLVLTKLVATTLLYIELLSIKENLEIATGKNYWKIFKQMIGRGKELKNELSDFIDKNDESNI